MGRKREKIGERRREELDEEGEGGSERGDVEGKNRKREGIWKIAFPNVAGL